MIPARTLTFRLDPAVERLDKDVILSHRCNGDVARTVDGYRHTGLSTRWMFAERTCCTTCVSAELLDGTAVIVNPDEMHAGYEHLLAARSGIGRPLARQIEPVLEAWTNRGRREADSLLRGVDYLIRHGELGRLRELLSAMEAVSA